MDLGVFACIVLLLCVYKKRLFHTNLFPRSRYFNIIYSFAYFHVQSNGQKEIEKKNEENEFEERAKCLYQSTTKFSQTQKNSQNVLISH